MNKNEYRIVCVVVTYNRKNLLKRCLEAVNQQSFKPTTVYIVDNASTDGTIESVQEWGFYNCVNNEIEYKYVRNPQNIGGAGGFYTGIKLAYESDADAVWVMDDDGQPEKDCLKYLVPYLGKYDYIAPIVLSDEDHFSCSFDFLEDNYDTIQEKLNSKEGVIENWASPFNGILYSNKLIHDVGYPKKEMFIWGDENNYHQKCAMKGYNAVTIINAIHYHPKDRQIKYPTRNNKKIIVPQEDWKLYCYIRNKAYNHKIHGFPWGVRGMIEELGDYKYYFKINNKNKTKILLSAIFDGYFERWNRIDNYR